MDGIFSHPVLVCAQKFALQLEKSAEVQRFRLAEQQIYQSETVQQCISNIKKKQKELVHAKHFQKAAYIQVLEDELAHLNQKMDHLPIVREYQQFQAEVNDLLQTIQQVLVDTISTKVTVEMGGEIAKGCSSGGDCGCKSK